MKGWTNWNPGEFDSRTIIREVLATMPVTSIPIPRIVKLLENPKSPCHLAGPAALLAHDVIHVVLGRGLLQQDEAFVIGYSMGNSSAASNLDRLWFLDAATNLYPKPFTFEEKDSNVFNIAFDLGLKSETKDIHLLDAKSLQEKSVESARAVLGIQLPTLLDCYEKEVSLYPDSKVSRRLRTTFAVGLI